MNRRQLILGISIFAVFILLIISGFALFKDRQSSQSEVERRFPLQRLSYCSSDPVTPCIVSFSLDSDGDMLVNFLTSGVIYPDFYLKIKQDEEQHIYACQKVNKFATSVYCTGAVLPLGKIFQFSIFSVKEDVLLAEGDFSIIGLAIGTPAIVSITPSQEGAVSATENVLQTLTPGPVTSTRTPTLPPSYPNTSYPNPSHPKQPYP